MKKILMAITIVILIFTLAGPAYASSAKGQVDNSSWYTQAYGTIQECLDAFFTAVDDPSVTFNTTDSDDTEWTVEVNADQGAASDDPMYIKADDTIVTGIMPNGLIAPTLKGEYNYQSLLVEESINMPTITHSEVRITGEIDASHKTVTIYDVSTDVCPEGWRMQVRFRGWAHINASNTIILDFETESFTSGGWNSVTFDETSDFVVVTWYNDGANSGWIKDYDNL